MFNNSVEVIMSFSCYCELWPGGTCVALSLVEIDFVVVLLRSSS